MCGEPGDVGGGGANLATALGQMEYGETDLGRASLGEITGTDFGSGAHVGSIGGPEGVTTDVGAPQGEGGVLGTNLSKQDALALGIISLALTPVIPGAGALLTYALDSARGQGQAPGVNVDSGFSSAEQHAPEQMQAYKDFSGSTGMTSPDKKKDEDEDKELERVRRGGTKTLMTGPLGVTGKASTTRRTLLKKELG